MILVDQNGGTHFANKVLFRDEQVFCISDANQREEWIGSYSSWRRSAALLGDIWGKHLEGQERFIMPEK